MSIKDDLMIDLKSAMKNKDVLQKNTVTMIRAGILQVEKDNKIELDDEGVVEVIAKQLKQRKDALEDFTKAGREDLIEQTNLEISFLIKYLPKQLTHDELTEMVKEVITENNITELKQM